MHDDVPGLDEFGKIVAVQELVIHVGLLRFKLPLFLLLKTPRSVTDRFVETYQGIVPSQHLEEICTAASHGRVHEDRIKSGCVSHWFCPFRV